MHFCTFLVQKRLNFLGQKYRKISMAPVPDFEQFSEKLRHPGRTPIPKGSDPLDPTMYSSGADLKPFEIQTCRMHIEGLVLSRE